MIQGPGSLASIGHLPAEYKTRMGRFGLDEKAVLKTICAFLLLLRPGDPTWGESLEYLDYALEGSRRVKEQHNILPVIRN